MATNGSKFPLVALTGVQMVQKLGLLAHVLENVHDVLISWARTVLLRMRGPAS